MALAPRNAPCPCGSGRKYKKCCGADRATERTLEARQDALTQLALLALGSPRLVPMDDRFDRWADTILSGSRDTHPRSVVQALPEQERARLLGTYAELFPASLSELSASCDDEAEVNGAIFAGAALAAVSDRQAGLLTELGQTIELIEESDDLVGDPFEALALVLEGDRLWGDVEGEAAVRELAKISTRLDDDAYEIRWNAALRSVCDRSFGEWHRLRLERLVRAVAAQLPVKGFPRASGAIAEGCRLFATDPELGPRLAATLLADLVTGSAAAAIDDLLAA